jgi:hypothetical protein
MAEDYLKAYPVERVAAWYRRLADAWSRNSPELQPALSGTFLRTWVDNRNPKAKIEFDAPAHLKESRAVFDTLAFHRDVFLTNKKGRFTGGKERWVGILPRIQGLPGFTKWNLLGSVSLQYESLCDIAPDIWAIGKIQRSGTAAERDIFGSLRGFQLKSEVTVVAQRAPRGGAISIQFSKWDASGTDRYDWNYSERLTVANPDYQSKAPDAIRPQDQTITVYHSNAKRLEDASQAAPFDVVLRAWRITDARLIGTAQIDPSRRL